MGKQTKITVTAIIKTIELRSRKVVRRKEGDSYSYYAPSKKECQQKAKSANHWNGYKKEYSVEED